MKTRTQVPFFGIATVFKGATHCQSHRRLSVDFWLCGRIRVNSCIFPKKKKRLLELNSRSWASGELCWNAWLVNFELNWQLCQHWWMHCSEFIFIGINVSSNVIDNALVKSSSTHSCFFYKVKTEGFLLSFSSLFETQATILHQSKHHWKLPLLPRVK